MADQKASTAMVQALVWPQRRLYKKTGVRLSESIKNPVWPTDYTPVRDD